MTENDQMRIAKTRNSFTGKTLTASQFDEAWAITGIMEREIRKTGSFREKLTDYAHAFSRSEKFDQMKGESIIRDVFTSRNGQSMSQMREGLMAREATLRETAQDQALYHARSIPQMIQDGETMPYYRAQDNAAVSMASQHGITESGSKILMKEAFREVEGKELYDVGKGMEKEFHIPKREAARQERETARSQQSERTPTMQP